MVMAGLGINLGDAYYINGVFAAGYRGRQGPEDNQPSWTHVVARPTCLIGRRTLEVFGLPKTFSMRVNWYQNREECKALACAWVDRMHFLTQHLSLARETNDKFFETYYTEREDLMWLFDAGTPWYRNRVRRMWRQEPVAPSSSQNMDSDGSTLAVDEHGTIIVT